MSDFGIRRGRGEDMMRSPISIPHTQHYYQIIFRRRGQCKNWNIYVDAETPEDAEREARHLLAYDRYHYRDDLDGDGDLTKDFDWVVAEVQNLDALVAAEQTRQAAL